MKDDLESKYIDIIEDNVNVSKTNILSEFVLLILSVLLVCICVYFCSDSVANILIDNFSNEQQLKIEKMLSVDKIKISKTHPEKIKLLNLIKMRIIKMDKKLQGKSQLHIYEMDDNQINAFVSPDGKIYFTKGLLDKINEEQILTFILAHELGHYAHRDHLKIVSRQIIAGSLLSFITSGQKDISTLINGFSYANRIVYSKNQEYKADLYANNIILKLYGTNQGAIDFFEFMKKEENLPEFLYYISSHPSNIQRIRLIKKVKKKKSD